MGIVLLAEAPRDDGDVSTVGISISVCAGVCIIGADPIGVMCKTGVEDGMTWGGGRTGVLLPVTNEGTDGTFDCECCWSDWPGYAGLFIISEELPIPLWDGLPVLSDERAWLTLSGTLKFKACATVVTNAIAVGKRDAGSLARLRMMAPTNAGGRCGLMSAGEVSVP